MGCATVNGTALRRIVILTLRKGSKTEGLAFPSNSRPVRSTTNGSRHAKQ